MAKISVEFDTETKQFTAAVDGKAVPNAMGAQIYPAFYDLDTDEDEKEWRCSIMAASKDPETGIMETRQLCASRKGGDRPSDEFPGLFEGGAPANQVERDVAACFGC